MVRLSSITTKTGDDGTTGLGDGTRVAKHSPRVEAMGAVDEANAALGLARLTAGKALDAHLARIQNDLFDLGADLCLPGSRDDKLRITPAQVARLEEDQAALNASLQPLNSFVLPGGSPTAAHLHMARTLTRRAERRLTALHASEPLNPELLRYINRLSDFLFVAARVANNQGKDDVLWVPGQGR